MLLCLQKDLGVKGLPTILSVGGRDRKVHGVFLPANFVELVSFRLGEKVFSLKNIVESNKGRHDIDLRPPHALTWAQTNLQTHCWTRNVMKVGKGNTLILVILFSRLCCNIT